MSDTTAPPADSGTRYELMDIGRIVISVVYTLLFATALILVLTRSVSDGPMSDLLVGALAAGQAAVLGFWVGSSASSSAKDATIKRQAETLPPSAPPGGTSTTTSTTTTQASSPAVTNTGTTTP